MNFPEISATKQTALYNEATKNPDWGDQADHVTFQKADITAMCSYVASSCRLPRYPELLQGYSQSGASPSTDISAIASNEFMIDVNGTGFVSVAITLANCTTGANTATELQTQIRALSNDGLDEVAVAYTTVYTITSGRYGESSMIRIRSGGESTKHVAQNLKLSPAWAGVEYVGGLDEPALDAAVIELAFAYYAKTGGGGTGEGGFGTSTTFIAPNQQTIVMRAEDIPPRSKGIMSQFRRL